MTDDLHAEPWERLEEIVRTGDAGGLSEYLSALDPGDLARAISRVDEDAQAMILSLLAPQEAANLILGLSETQSTDMLRRLAPAQVAAVLDCVPSDEQADLLARMGEDRARAVLERMSPAEAQDARQLSRYLADTAGGLMITEYLAYPQHSRVGDVIVDLRRHVAEYARYDLQYLYVTNGEGRLTGVLRFRDLLLAPEEALVTSIMIAEPHRVGTDESLEELRTFFDRQTFFGAPVTDAEGRLVGVVLRSDVEETLADKADRSFLLFSGLLGGDEFRTMPLHHRVFRRLAWLSCSIVLNLLAASIVGLYQETLKAAIALAVFLPIISGLGGNSGTQAMAVSVRELSLGLVKPFELWWVLVRETAAGVLIGLALGALLGAIASLWTGNLVLGVLVGSAMAMTMLVSVCVGGALPLLLTRMKVDPALASAPLTTTLTDACGFFVTLATATAVLPWLV